jgi:hypothetical protein
MAIATEFNNMARFIQDSPEDLQDDEELNNFDEEQQEAQEPTPDVEELEVPEKYQGKSIKDIVQMHQEAEKLLGRQSSEVGELRRIVDDFVKTQLKEPSPQQKDEDLDFFEDPDRYIEHKLSSHPKIKEAEELSRSMKQAEILNKLQSNHPDFKEIIGDERFGEWVAKSKVRTELYQRADQRFDFDAADELLTSWKERQNIVKETNDLQKDDRKRQLKSASTGSAKGSGERPSRKVYRRADIIKLMQTDPDRYMALAGEIRQAYAEGRVK